jgi:hypothetical protein
MKSGTKALTVLLVAYAAASLLHYAHNAEFLAEYPNMPAWLSRTKVYAAWLALSALGSAGYLLFLRGYRLAGLLTLGAYAAAGFDGLGHYGLAPASAHSAEMNATIWLEAGTATLLLIAVTSLLAKRPRRAYWVIRKSRPPK